MKIGVIGYGSRMSGYYNDETILKGFIDCLNDWEMDVRMTAITDINLDKVKYVLKKKGIDEGSISLYTDADEMMQKEELDGVVVATNCSTHTKMVLKAMKYNLPIYLEKPVSTNIEDLLKLKMANETYKKQIIVSFPLRLTPLVQLAKEIVSSGRLGTIEHVQAVNNVPYGGVYFHSWYRDESVTGGLFLQKATHDFDYINYLLGLKPIDICAMKSKQIFKGNKPAGLLCKNCDEYFECSESPFVMSHIKSERLYVLGDYCCFAEDTGNEDSGSAIIRYETGMHASYSQNFFARKTAHERGVRFIGYNGTLEFSWRTSELKVHMHNTPRVETYQIDVSQMSHAGGDEALAYNFIQVMQGKQESKSPLDAGILSALMSIKAKESAETDTFQKICFSFKECNH